MVVGDAMLKWLWRPGMGVVSVAVILFPNAQADAGMVLSTGMSSWPFFGQLNTKNQRR